jgi:hypothetical protein
MTEPENIDAPTRRGTRRARQARTRRIAGVVLSVVMLSLIVATGLVVAGVVELPAADNRVGAAGSPPDSTTTTTTRPHQGPTRRALDPDAPLRLWIAGDSLAGSVGPSLGELTADTGVVAPVYDSRVSSGLLNPDFFDWPEHAGEQLEELDPEAVVFVVGTNDANVWSPDLAADYRVETEALMRLLTGDDHRTVYWVGPPVARDDDLEEGVLAVTEIQRDAAKAVKGVTYVDAHSLFADDDGEYQQSFPNELGQRKVMRAGDGVHFSVDGADYLSRAIFRMLDENWDLTEQADPTKPQRVKEAEGSTQVPGTHRSVSSSGRSGSGTATTTTTRSSVQTTTTTAPTATSSTSATTATTAATITTTTTTP